VGNHDLGSIGKVDLSSFHADARVACEWTADELNDDARRFLEELKGSALFGDVSVAHGSPRNPIWEYVSHLQVAVTNFGHFSTQACLIGHTHVPCVYRWLGGMLGTDAFSSSEPLPNSAIELGDDRLIINPGSVGQPRDGDSRAAYACYEPKTGVMSFHRVEYDVDATQVAIRRARLPDRLAVRLQCGT
jgi:diadenosine tetraphosphatase ApaH/serine/threonine PP2A family protein phosphatase